MSRSWIYRSIEFPESDSPVYMSADYLSKNINKYLIRIFLSEAANGFFLQGQNLLSITVTESGDLSCFT